MHFNPSRTRDDLETYFPAFLDLCGGTRWWKRVDQLDNEGGKSPFLLKIMSDHHWLEFELSAQIAFWQEHGRLLPGEISPRSMAALLFAGMVVETHKEIGSAARKNLLGRLRDSLKRDFAGLYFEMDVAAELINQGFDVEFPDFEGTGAPDIRFGNGTIVGEVECKSLSADAGRKIHRKDFYRFIDALGSNITDYALSSSQSILVITLDDRLSPNTTSQRPLRRAASRVLIEAGITQLTGPNFQIELEPYERHFGRANFENSKEFYAACYEAFGSNCHVSGAMSETGGCLVVVRSRREDDPSKPQLEVVKKAASQLSGDYPGFVALQFEDIEPPNLTLPHFRRRAALLANVVFHSNECSHLAGVYHTAYGLYSEGGLPVKPAFVCWNPSWAGTADGLPFRAGVSNSEFAFALGVDPTKTDPDDYIYGREV